MKKGSARIELEILQILVVSWGQRFGRFCALPFWMKHGKDLMTKRAACRAQESFFSLVQRISTAFA